MQVVSIAAVVTDPTFFVGEQVEIIATLITDPCSDWVIQEYTPSAGNALLSPVLLAAKVFLSQIRYIRMFSENLWSEITGKSC